MFCPHCGKEIQPNASLNYCPSCGKFLTEDVSEIRKQTIVKLAKFDLPPQALFESCISSVDELGLTIDKIDRVSRYIEAVYYNGKESSSHFFAFDAQKQYEESKYVYH